MVHSLLVIGSISDCLEPKKWLPWNCDVTLYHSIGAWRLFKISVKRRGKEGGLIERALNKFLSFLSCNLRLGNLFKEKLKLPQRRRVHINVFRLLKQWLVVKRTVVLFNTLHTDVSACS